MIFVEKITTIIWIWQSYLQTTVSPFFPQIRTQKRHFSMTSQWCHHYVVSCKYWWHFTIFQSHGLSGRFVPKIIKSCLNLSKLWPKYCWSLFSRHGVHSSMKPKTQRRWKDRQKKQARSKPDTVDRPVRTACTTFLFFFYPVLVFKVLRLSLKPG